MLERNCALARRMATRLAASDGVTILNDVVLNQVLVRFAPPSGSSPAADPEAEADAFTRRVIAAIQADGTCWAGATTWHGKVAMRISVSNWSTTEHDADDSVDAMLRCAKAVGELASASA
jgi:glutamate/tyrosine decarboxylase-like PLP-dependent enzyme